jgi:hypothetical protein
MQDKMILQWRLSIFRKRTSSRFDAYKSSRACFLQSWPLPLFIDNIIKRTAICNWGNSNAFGASCALASGAPFTIATAAY